MNPEDLRPGVVIDVPAGAEMYGHGPLRMLITRVPDQGRATVVYVRAVPLADFGSAGPADWAFPYWIDAAACTLVDPKTAKREAPRHYAGAVKVLDHYLAKDGHEPQGRV